MDLFERVIRPALIEHCQDCHASDTEASGGLLLDSRDGWLAGGDSGVAIVAGDAEASRVFRAIAYDDPELQMPPDGKLPEPLIDAFRKWINDGAADPRRGDVTSAKKQTGLPVDRAQEHWAYRPLTAPQAPDSLGSSTIDGYIHAKLAESGIAPLDRASAPILARRLYYDLTGLPPTLDELQDFCNSNSPNAYEELVDRLLASPRFGEHLGRKWLDVARYADSITLRGFVLPEAWRYRDYVVAAYAEDRPFDVMIQEQLAGDLLDSDDWQERARQEVATAFLAMGNTNLEQQDKTQLEMDYIDEQLEVVGRAFLGQTIGCARCHDHKFDPIPTRDYYALAGVFRSAVALEHENVSKWIERPLPLRADEVAIFEDLSQQMTLVNREITDVKKRLQLLARNATGSVPLSEIAGVVVDSADAKLVGEWVHSTHIQRFVGDGYIHDGNSAQGTKTATFEPRNLPPGEYEVRLAYSAYANRASNTQVHVFSADGETVVELDQQKAPQDAGLWASLGKYHFEKDGQAYVLVSNRMANGHVVLDAVQFRPLADAVTSDAKPAKAPVVEPQPRDMDAKLTSLEKRKKELQRQLDQRPRFLTVVETSPPRDVSIHIRGDVHNLAEVVPRGFLTALGSPQQAIAKDSSGRREFAEWLCSAEHPLTARVYANRVWLWLMGQGIVATPNNFGTTGAAPSHPHLLDWLANELVASGWSTKHLVRLIVLSDAYQRRWAATDSKAAELDPDNQLYWRGTLRRLNVEALRDAMLAISGELDNTMSGSLIRQGTKADYHYQHGSTRRSLYHPVFRNSLPEMFEAFDFADTSVSIGERPRSTVATQALVLMNHPWVTARAHAAAGQLATQFDMQAMVDTPQTLEAVVEHTYQRMLSRSPTEVEMTTCVGYLLDAEDDAESRLERLEQLVHSLFASLDFRYLE